MHEQLSVNKQALIKKWKLKDIIFQSNWSLKHFNLYLLALNNLNFTMDAKFEGFTIVLTNNSFPGLRKNGFIHLNCGQVYQQWLDVNNIFINMRKYSNIQIFLRKSFKIYKRSS